MREAFGGMFMLRLMLVFIFIYVVFAAISYNYAQAFKLKNSIISYIEENDIVDFKKILNSADDNTLSAFDEILSSYTYRVTCNGEDGIIEARDELDPDTFCYHGIVLEANENNNIITYKVNTFVYMNLPLINRFYMFAANNNARHVKDGSIQITGEAKVVKRIAPSTTSEET